MNTDFFHGAVVHHDTNQTNQTTSVVYGDGDSNDKIKFLPCLESDYQDALNDNLPIRWLKASKRI